MPGKFDQITTFVHIVAASQRGASKYFIFPAHVAALVCKPRLVIAVKPTTALDVTTQLQILKPLKSLVRAFDVSMLLVIHDFGVVA